MMVGSGFNIQGTTSGRLSSSGNLNYQNIPRDNKDIKKLNLIFFYKNHLR